MSEKKKKETKKDIQEFHKPLESGEHVLSELEKCEKERKEYLDGWKRAKADLINSEKEAAEMLSKTVKFANEALLLDLIPVLESFIFGIQVIEKQNVDAEGLKRIMRQLDEVLTRRGVKKIETNPGDAFDPTKHEAMAEVESDHAPGTIAHEVERGYILNDKVVRAARVHISKQK